VKTNFQQTTINPSKTQNLNYVKSNKKLNLKIFPIEKKIPYMRKKEKKMSKNQKIINLKKIL